MSKVWMLLVAIGARLDLLHSALSAWRSIKSLNNEIPWPGDTSSLEPEKAESVIPACLYNLLLWIIDGYQDSSDVNLEIKQPTENSIVHRQVVSIAQDIIHSTSKGTPKHILLPLTIHSMTGSKNAATLLNRFGHGISYTIDNRVKG